MTELQIKAEASVLLSRARLKRRYRAERRFRGYGIAALIFAGGILLTLLLSIIYNATPAFTHTEVRLTIVWPDRAESAPDELPDWGVLGRDALYAYFSDVSGRAPRRALRRLLSDYAGRAIARQATNITAIAGEQVMVNIPLSDDADLYFKNPPDDTADGVNILSPSQILYLKRLADDGRLHRRFAIDFFVSGDSREPESAGIRAALVGTLWTMLVVFLISFPLGVMAAIYLEEIAPQNRLTDFIEVNINNLAAVPSVVFGLLGLAVFINFFNLPRSSPLVGGMVLALMTLPVIIIATRAALAAVPPSVREAALGIGASRLQVILHHVLPLAVPGILTGTIIGTARAAGETAPLLLVGMMAFIADTPRGFTEATTVLPAQIFMWANNPEHAFVARTSAAILILLLLLLCVNGLAIFLRRKFERRW